jgi:hypothetical protein
MIGAHPRTIETGAPLLVEEVRDIEKRIARIEGALKL